jgi:hypothetical protein
LDAVGDMATPTAKKTNLYYSSEAVCFFLQSLQIISTTIDAIASTPSHPTIDLDCTKTSSA